MITSPSCQVLIEAKRLRRSRFQATQLACQYLALTHTAAERTPLLLLLGTHRRSWSPVRAG